MVFETGTLGGETKTVVSKPETILLATGKMVSLIKKIFCFAKTMVSGIGTMVCVKKTMVSTSETTVTAAKKTVSVAPPMVCKVLSIVFFGPNCAQTLLHVGNGRGIRCGSNGEKHKIGCGIDRNLACARKNALSQV